MSSNVDAMVRAGVDAYRAGNKVEARALLERAIELDGYNETAWLWLSAVVETQEEQQTCLENVLVINPENSRAIQGLKSLGVDPQALIDANQVEAEPSVGDASAVFTDDISFDDASDDVFGDIDFSGDNGQEEDLFGDIDFSDDGGAFGIDDSIFADDTDQDDEDSLYDDGDYTYDDTGDFGLADDAVFDEYDDGDDMFADIGTLENYTDAVGDDIDYDASQFSGDPFAPPPAEPDPSAEPTPDELFAKIPKDIEATRAPGVVETIPQVHYIVLGVLAVVNLGALLFIGFQFVS